jgi:hypothetical protein
MSCRLPMMVCGFCVLLHGMTRLDATACDLISRPRHGLAVTIRR